MLKFNYVLLMACFLSAAVHSQQSISYDMPEIVGQTPDVASIQKFSETSVSYSTGIPNISIPIFSLPSRELEVPVNLSYHAGGHRVTEESSSVGLGWNLFAGGQITRTVKSQPDDDSNGFIYTDFTVDYVENLCNSGTTDVYGRGCNQYTGTYAQDQKLDYEPDDFNYSMLGLSGRFMFNQNRIATPYGEIVQFPHKNVIITPTFANNSPTNPSGEIISWNIVDTNGTTYYFVKGNTFYSNGTFQKINGAIEIPSEGDDLNEYTETWNLKTVTTLNGDTILFNYSSPVLSNNPNAPYNEETCIESSDALIVQEGNETVTTSTSLPKRVTNFSITKRTYTRLTDITTSQGKVKVIYDSASRLDMQSEKNRIKYLELYDVHNSLIKQVELVHNYFLSSQPTVGYFIGSGYSIPNTDSFINRRMYLDEVIVRGGESVINGITGEEYKYKLSYNTNTMLPHKRSYSQDHWGFYNGENNSSLLQAPNYISNSVSREVNPSYSDACILTSIEYPEGGITEFIFENNEADSSINLVQHVTKSRVIQAYLSNYHVITVNGSDTIYEFTKEFTLSNDAVSDSNFPSKTRVDFSGFTTRCLDNTDQLFTGENAICEEILLKIYKEVSGQPDLLMHSDHIWSNNYVLLDKNSDYKAVIEITTTNNNYDFQQYESEANVSWLENDPNAPINSVIRNYLGGLRIKEIKNYDAVNSLATHKEYEYSGGRIMSLPTYVSASTGSVVKFVSQSWVPLLTTQSSYVNYKDVIERIIPNNYDPNSNPIVQDNNIIKRTYSNQAAAPAFPTAPFTGQVFIGKQQFEEIPDIKKTSFHYTSFVETISQPVKGFSIDRPYYLNDPTNPSYIDAFGTSQIETLLLCANTGVCDISRNLYVLTPKSRMLIGQDDKSFFRDDNNLIQEVVSSSDYLYDYAAGSYYNLMQSAIVTNSENDVIETLMNYPHELNNQTLITDNRIAQPLETITKKNGQVIQQSRSNYSLFGNHYLVDNVEASKGDYSFEQRLKYHNYDSFGKPTEVSKTNGTHVYYIYGYQNALPIAKIINFTSNNAQQIQTLIDDAITASNLDSDRSIGLSGFEGNLRDKLNVIRNHSLLNESQITTYTYDPLIGITSITDPRGYTIYYEYDELHRLKYVIDNDGHYLSENEYFLRN